MGKPYPWYYAVNDRPVQIVALPDGGADCLVFDFDTGGFTPDRAYFAHVAPGSGKDVDALTAAEFERLVAARRADAARLRREAPIAWEFSVEDGPGYRAAHRGRRYLLRLNPPDRPPYTLLVDGQAVEDLDGWPPAWTRLDADAPAPAAPDADTPGIDPALLREWSERLCRVASRAPRDLILGMGLYGALIDYLTYHGLEPPPTGVAEIRVVNHPAGFEYVEMALTGRGPTRAQLDAHFGAGDSLPRVHPESDHTRAYTVAVPGAPYTCAVFAAFRAAPAPTTVAKAITFRRDRAALPSPKS
jgi:hypothetical protein